MSALWLHDTPLLLASQSAARQALLKAAAIPFEAIGSGVNEREVEAPLLANGAKPSEIALCLARAKAQAVAKCHDNRLVLGADQTLSLDDRLFAKPPTLAEARAELLGFSGRTHALHSAVCIISGDTIRFETVVTARLTCRAFEADFIDRYIDAAGEGVLASVGAYQLEGLGIHLFERIDGDHATILGLPLLPLLAFFRREGFLAG